jgi:hypothetical protein
LVREQLYRDDETVGRIFWDCSDYHIYCQRKPEIQGKSDTHLDSTDFDVQQRLNALKASFVAKGMTPDAAMNAAYKMLDLSVTKQATVLSYMDVFLYLGVIFLICIPFIFSLKKERVKKNRFEWCTLNPIYI